MEIRIYKACIPPKSYTGTTNKAGQNNGHRAGVSMEFGLILIPVDRFQQHGTCGSWGLYSVSQASLAMFGPHCCPRRCSWRTDQVELLLQIVHSCSSKYLYWTLVATPIVKDTGNHGNWLLFFPRFSASRFTTISYHGYCLVRPREMVR